jgi:type II secretory pathway component PulF
VKTYKSKLGIGLIIPIIPFLITLINSLNQKSWVLVIICIIFLSLLLHLFFTTKYIISQENLNIKSSFFYNLNIDIKTIRKVSETNNILSSPATSIDRLEIFYNKFDSILVSPKEKKEFIKHLITINQNIEVKYKKARING